MFEQAETDPVMEEAEFTGIEDRLRADLLLAQYGLLRRADKTVLLVIAGIDGAGKGSTINLLNEWLDTRHMRTLAFSEPTRHERRRPAMARYWDVLPARGHLGVVFGSWYAPLLRRALKKKKRSGPRWDAMVDAIMKFETMLAAEGVQVIKLWFHLSREAQRERCTTMLADPDTAWRVSLEDLAVADHYARLRDASKAVVEATQNPVAPWMVVPSADIRLRIVTVARTVLQAFCKPALQPLVTPRLPQPSHDSLSERDYTAKLSREQYDSMLPHWQGRLSRAVRTKAFRKRSLIVVFEGDDAAGKGGAIRRMVHALDARQYRVVPISAPTDEELARPYLWRFWRNIPADGHITIFDRSWYGRVLVERVEGLTAPEDWERAYAEIVEFEHQLAEHGALVVKFLLTITPDEQLSRFHEREQTEFKSFKITDEDWRNREKTPQYRVAASEMLARTQSKPAPWHVLATDDKKLARITVLETVARALEALDD